MKTFNSFIKEASAEEWENQTAGDEEGNSYKVKDLYTFAEKHGVKQHIPIADTDALEWWDKSYSMGDAEHVQRVHNADTSFPVLAVEYKKGKYSIADGLNRVKKAHMIEKKTHVPALIIQQSDMKAFNQKK